MDVVAAVRGGSDLAAEGPVLDDVRSLLKDLGWPLLVHMNRPSNIVVHFFLNMLFIPIM